MKVCPTCGHVNHCERCTQYTCVCCGAELDERPGAMPAVVRLQGILAKGVQLCNQYEKIGGRTRSTKELAWQQRRILEDAMAVIREMTRA